MISQDNTNNNRANQHKKFITSLEKHGSAAGSEHGTLAWHAMAIDLDWSVEEVKIYAYNYFKILAKATDSTGMKPPSSSSSSSSWSFEEKVVFDSLMLKYAKDLKRSCGDQCNTNYFSQPTVWEKIAASLPGKSAHECRKMGALRLSMIDA